MKRLLESTEIQELAIRLEEATRATSENIHRFVEPSHGALLRSTSKRHHIIFGRRGSGKSSLLRKAAADLTVDRRPIAYVDLESFKGHSYPDVLLSVLIKTFKEFEKWLSTAAINPSTKVSFWGKLFGSKPHRPAFNKKEAADLASALRDQIKELETLLFSADQANIQQTSKTSEEQSEQKEAALSAKGFNMVPSAKASDTEKKTYDAEIMETFARSKIDFLHRHIMQYQDIFDQMSLLSDGDAYLFLDDLYHIRRSDQAKVIDYFHRIGKGHNLWLKIGTIKYRTQWNTPGDPPIGLKLGDDADDIDLDLTLEKYSQAKDFLTTILNGYLDDTGNIKLQDIVVDDAIGRLILASGGVARDFLGIFRRSIAVAIERITRDRSEKKGGKIHEKIGMEDVNKAAGEYDATKQEELRRDTLDDHDKLEQEFNKIRKFCIDDLRSNVFLLDKNASEEEIDLIQQLVDLRLIHKVDSRVTVKDINSPNKIYEAYMLDISQYTGVRKIHSFNIIPFWRKGRDGNEQLRKKSLIYDPTKPTTSHNERSKNPPKPSDEQSSQKEVQDKDTHRQKSFLEQDD